MQNDCVALRLIKIIAIGDTLIFNFPFLIFNARNELHAVPHPTSLRSATIPFAVPGSFLADGAASSSADRGTRYAFP